MDTIDYKFIEEFLQEFIKRRHFLHWLEIISIINATKGAHDALLSLYNWLKVRYFKVRIANVFNYHRRTSW